MQSWRILTKDLANPCVYHEKPREQSEPKQKPVTSYVSLIMVKGKP